MPATGAAGSAVIARSRLSQLRVVPALARADAWLLSRSVLILAGLLAGGAIIWLTDSGQPLWWNVGWMTGYGQVLLAMAVLIAAHLASSRYRRDAMADLYASFPVTAAQRTLGQLMALVGALPAGLLLIGGTAVAALLADPIGVPNAWSLAGGLLLVIAAGAAGLAIGTRFPHSLAGVIGALVLFVPFSQSNRLSGPGIWLYPWIKPPQLADLPGPLAGYPPAAAHAAELGGLTIVAGIVALAMTITSTRARAWVAILGVLGLAATCLAGAAQLRPIPVAEVNHLVQEVADPESAQHCSIDGQARYCLYPGFGPELRSIQAPVGAVLARLPVYPAQRLLVLQAAPLSPDLTLTHGHPERQVSRWNALLQRAPGNGGGGSSSAIYLPVTVKPSDARFYLALAAGEWAVHLQQTITTSGDGQCVPVNQAREAIAIWLALLATHSRAGDLQSGLNGPNGQQSWLPISPQGITVAVWNYPGESLGNLPLLGPQNTAAGYLLAGAMASVPQQKVTRVLRAGWSRWMNWHTTDGQLATALGISMPAVPHFDGALPPGGQPLNPVCTT